MVSRYHPFSPDLPRTGQGRSSRDAVTGVPRRRLACGSPARLGGEFEADRCRTCTVCRLARKRGCPYYSPSQPVAGWVVRCSLGADVCEVKATGFWIVGQFEGEGDLALKQVHPQSIGVESSMRICAAAARRSQPDRRHTKDDKDDEKRYPANDDPTCPLHEVVVAQRRTLVNDDQGVEAGYGVASGVNAGTIAREPALIPFRSYQPWFASTV